MIKRHRVGELVRITTSYSNGYILSDKFGLSAGMFEHNDIAVVIDILANDDVFDQCSLVLTNTGNLGIVHNEAILVCLWKR